MRINNPRNKNSGYILKKIQSLGDLQMVADYTGINDDVCEGWRPRIKSGGIDMVVAYFGKIPVGRVNVIWVGVEGELLKKEIGSIPMASALVVNEDNRGKGIGRLLMIECEGLVKSRSEMPQVLALGVEPDNVIARKLYEDMGYEYRKISGKNTFTVRWLEGPPENRQLVEHSVMLMVKDLN